MYIYPGVRLRQGHVLSLLPTRSAASPDIAVLFHVLRLSVGGPTVLALST